MNNKSTPALLLAIAAALGGPVAVDAVIKQNTAPVTVVTEAVAIAGPTEVEVGELLTLDLIGDKPCWKIDTQDRYDVSPNRVVLSYRTVGTYTIIASALSDGNPAIVEHTITVRGPPETEPEPTPEPVVVVPPTPEPTPAPRPELAQLVVIWCNKYAAPAEKCKPLGQNFIMASNGADSIQDLMDRVAKANRSTDQKGCEEVLAEIQQYLLENLKGKDFATHRQAFDEIGAGLLHYSGHPYLSESESEEDSE